MADKDKEQLQAGAQPTAPGEATPAGGEAPQPDADEKLAEAIRESAREDDPKPSPTLTLRKILGGDILNAQLVRSQIWLVVLIVLFTIVYVAFRYQCQQDMIAIDKLETELKDAKYKALSSSSALTERCRESHILEMLKNNADSLRHPAEQPPYIINVPEEEQ